MPHIDFPTGARVRRRSTTSAGNFIYSGEGIVEARLEGGTVFVNWGEQRGFTRESTIELERVRLFEPIEQDTEGKDMASPSNTRTVEIMHADAMRDPYKQRFWELLLEVWDMVNKKGADYGDKDSLANLHASEKFGIPPWIGVLLRNNDKWNRIINLCDGHSPAVKDEGLRDTLLDHAAYDLLAYILHEEAGGTDFRKELWGAREPTDRR